MSESMVIAIIVAALGGGLTGLATLITAMAQRGKNKTDERMKAWEEINRARDGRVDRIEQELKSTKLELEAVKRYCVSHERRGLALEATILRMDPNAEIPPAPVLEAWLSAAGS